MQNNKKGIYYTLIIFLKIYYGFKTVIYYN